MALAVQPLKTPRTVHLALIVVQLFFGLWHVAGSATLQYISPEALIGFRVFLGAPLLLLAAGAFKRPLPSLTDALHLAGLGIFGVVINQLLYANGLALCGPINASVIILTVPILTLAFAWGLKKEDPSKWRAVGAVVALLGTMIIIDPTRFDLSNDRWVGNLLIFANASSYAFYLVLARGVFSRVGFLPGIAWVFAFGALESLPFTASPFLNTDWAALPTEIHASLLFILVGPTLGAYALNAYALERTESTLVGAYIYLQPFIATLAGWWFLDATLQLQTLLAGIIICFGLAFCTGLLPMQNWKKAP